MLSILENKNYRVKVHAKGAELKSFIKKDEAYEVIWILSTGKEVRRHCFPSLGQ